MSGFHETRLSTKYSFGSLSGPTWKTDIIELDSGHEERVGHRDSFRDQFELVQDVKDPDEVAELLRFAKARQGALFGFRVKDQWDWSSNADGHEPAGERDVQIGTGDGATVGFQLVKRYTDGLATVTKNVRKPVAGTVRIWVNAVEQTETTHFTVDTTTGVVTFVTPPAAGLSIEASYEFDKPARFTREIDQWFQAARTGPEAARLPPITAIEILDPSAPYTDFPYGGSEERTISGNVALSTGIARTWVLSATTTGCKAMLPDPADVPDGDRILRVHVEGANDIEITDKDLVSLSPAMVLSPGEGCDIALSDDGGGGKTWYAF